MFSVLCVWSLDGSIIMVDWDRQEGGFLPSKGKWEYSGGEGGPPGRTGQEGDPPQTSGHGT